MTFKCASGVEITLEYRLLAQGVTISVADRHGIKHAYVSPDIFLSFAAEANRIAEKYRPKANGPSSTYEEEKRRRIEKSMDRMNKRRNADVGKGERGK